MDDATKTAGTSRAHAALPDHSTNDTNKPDTHNAPQNTEHKAKHEQENANDAVKHETPVVKVIKQMKTKRTTFENVQDQRIADCIRTTILKKKLKVHGKMRKADILEIAHRFLKKNIQRV